MFPTKVLPVTDKGDLEKIVDIEERAFGAASPLLRLIYPISPSPSSAILRSSKIARHEHVWQSDPTVHYIKAVTYETSPDGATSERIIGAAVYNIYESTHTASEQNPWPRSSDEVPKGANAPLCLHYFGTLTKARLDFTNGKPHAFLENLAVDPNFQRRGVGTKLLEFMISDIAARYADEGLDNVGCWLDSSPSGLKMYQNLGWEDVGSKSFDLEPWGGAKGQVHKNMVLPFSRLPAFNIEAVAESSYGVNLLGDTGTLYQPVTFQMQLRKTFVAHYERRQGYEVAQGDGTACDLLPEEFGVRI